MALLVPFLLPPRLSWADKSELGHVSYILPEGLVIALLNLLHSVASALYWIPEKLQF